MIEEDRPAARSSSPPDRRPPDDETAQMGPPRGFRRWIASNVRFIRTLLLVSIYVSGALFLVTIFLFGGIRLPSKILAAICVLLIAFAIASLGFKAPG
jgi:hypothetical protein